MPPVVSRQSELTPGTFWQVALTRGGAGVGVGGTGGGGSLRPTFELMRMLPATEVVVPSQLCSKSTASLVTIGWLLSYSSSRIWKRLVTAVPQGLTPT